MAEPTAVIIENLEDLADVTHKCTSQEILTAIRISQARTEESMINLSSTFQDLTLRLDEQSRQFQEFVRAPYVCIYKDQILQHTASIEYLKEESHRREGQSRWEDRVWNVGQAVLVAALVAVVLYLMKGGAIS
ncbi:MAG: hypothetical protein M0Q91_10045 [Methanoregula sp.]|jgi:hypothetical protein|nr:hypothetical protein [Methanoregula sp.]